eukprot:2021131-Pyramimonas_sp.AAC.1
MPGWRQRDRSRSPTRQPNASLPWGWNSEVAHWMHGWAWGRAVASDVVRNASAQPEEGSDELVRRLARGIKSLQNSERLLESIVLRGRLPPTLSLHDSVAGTSCPLTMRFTFCGN